MENKYYRNGSVVGGVVLILLGLIFFAATQGTFGFDWGSIWPLFPIVAGLAMLTMAFVQEDVKSRVGFVIGGTIPLLLGAFFLATTTGILSWSDQGTLWPIYPLIVGVAFLAAYVASGLQNQGLMIAGGLLSLIGVVFLGITLTGTSYDYMGKIWPIFLIIGGVLMLVLPRARRGGWT